jgi:hypothetical protein
MDNKEELIELLAFELSLDARLDHLSDAGLRIMANHLIRSIERHGYVIAQAEEKEDAQV